MPRRYQPSLRLSDADVTPESVYLSRRQWLAQVAAGLTFAALPASTSAFWGKESAQAPRQSLNFSQHQGPWPGGELTPEDKVTSYNNFYEFGTAKGDPAANAQGLRTRPWTLTIDGLVEKPVTLDIDSLLGWLLEERIYRLRCVEGWSMVIPWVGWSLAELIRRVEPTGNARYVEFHTLADPKQMPGVSSRVLDWPYVEGLRLDEAMHPLTLLAFGLYGEVLPNQNGAPVRLVVPWKYGFKSAKSIVRIRFTERQPLTAWNRSAPQEYGFYSNVNPEVDHPRWSQATERRIGEDGLFARKRPTLPFNGYGAQVASLYAGMDLKKFF